ncbi:hypothetical protein OYT1_ch1352 [Ferriphaselus amnicola]|uniref:Uncharacterized protein n=1 Tax=Ferriphaselus amnicola TaxID=1188319 RepID=A0A2Z6GC75_9PROT|nr:MULTISPECIES: phage tail protein [Ferriphaselus]BBE50909.1 hypothetical protein OYT1_ch1352 [Ferriphaselus amnicola]
MGGLFGGGGQNIATSETRLGAIRFQTSAFGYPIPILYGQNRISGNLIWYGNFTPIAHTTTQSAGGKGGGGGTSSNTTYTYTTGLMIGLCEGQVAGIQRIWQGKNVMTLAQARLTQYVGAPGQAAWGFLTTSFAGQDLNYPNLAYVCSSNFDLGNSANLPNLSYEMAGKLRYSAAIVDANPASFIADFLTNDSYGALFPAGKLGSMSQFSNYCVANGIFLSPVVDAQKSAAEWITQWLKACNSTVIFSDGVLKFIPYGDEVVTGNGVTFTPSLTPLYDLTDDDFIGDTGSDPVIVTRTPQSDAFNRMQVEFSSRANNYNPEIAEAKDQANIEAYGLRPNNPVKIPEICTLAVARHVAQLMLQRGLYVRNHYEFRLPWKYALLEPMDIVTLTDSALGLDREPVRIVSIEEDAEGLLSVIAEELPIGVAGAAKYVTQGGTGFQIDYNAAPGNANAPVIFEAPDLLTAGSGLEIWIATSGGANWGGYEVWVSRDNATYQRVGEMHGKARHGVLTAAMATGGDPDTLHSLAVDISISGGQLTGGTQANADALNTLCYVDGELLAFQSATLTGVGKYTLGTYLRRGAYGTTIGAHNKGSLFARLDKAVFKYPFTADMIGTPVYLKLLSFNLYGGAKQTLDTVQPITWNVTGAALKSPLPNVTGLSNAYRNGQTLLSWQLVTDFRTVDYEIRRGTNWQTAIVLGRTPLTEFVIAQNGTYWVAAHYSNAQGVTAYSATPVDITIGGAILPANVVASWNEAATGWAGTCTTPAFRDPVEQAVKLGGSALFSAIPLISAANTVEYYGGIATGGYYQIPVSHEIDIGTAQACNVSVGVQAASDTPFALVSTIPVFSAQASVQGNFSGKSSLAIEIDTAQNNLVWQGWRPFVPGQYIARRFRFRVKLISADPTVSTILTGMTFSVDMPDRVDTGTALAVPAAGKAVVFATPFQIVPNVQITILNPVAGDVIAFPAQPTTTGFTVQITNAGVGVARNINWLAKGY